MQWGSKITKFPEAEYRIDGVKVEAEHFRWASTEPVYTDGSASHVGTPMSVGGAGAYQVTKTGSTWCVRSMRITVPTQLEASAILCEHWAMWAASAMPTEDGGPIQIVTDCASVANHKLGPESTKGRRKFAGFFEFWEKLLPIRWVRSHLSVEQGLKLGFQEADIRGNGWADLIAGDAAALAVDHKNRGEKFDWILAGTHTVQSIIANMERLAKGTFEAYEVQPKRAVIRARAHIWARFSRRWKCNECGLVSAKPLRNVRQKCFGKFEHLAHVHPSHNCARFSFSDGTTCIACTACGHYSAVRFARLASQCRARGSGEVSQSGKRLRRGLHPDCRNKSIWEEMVRFDPATLRVVKGGWGTGGFAKGSSRLAARRSWRLSQGLLLLGDARAVASGAAE